MRKYFLSIVALVGMLFATSCQESLVEPQIDGTTTFTVQLPDAMGTKAYGDEISTKATINKLYVEVYSKDGDDQSPVFVGDFDVNEAQAKVSLNLVATQKYDIIFWAQNDNAYSWTDLRSIVMNTKHHNLETGAAFYAVLNDFEPLKSGTQEVILRRPFAQLNLGTTTTVSTGEVQVLESTIEILGVAKTFDRVIDQDFGQGGDSDVNAWTYTYNSIDQNEVPTGTISVNNVEYTYVSMDYFAVPGNRAVVDVKATIKVLDPKTNAESVIVREIKQVPVQMNYRTNIVGNLISSTTDFVVTIEEGFVDENEQPNPDNNIVVVESAAAAQAALDNAKPGDVIELVAGVDYGTLYLRPVKDSPATKEVDWIGNNYRWETYTLFENITILGAEGATVDAIEIEGGTYYNTEHSQMDKYPVMLSLIELKNVVIDGVTFTGKGGYDPQGYGNAINLSGSNIKVDRLTLKNCVLDNQSNNARLIYKTESTTTEHKYTYDSQTKASQEYTFTPSLKDITITGTTFNGGYMGLELRETMNLTITNNVFNVGDRNILLASNSGCTYSGIVTITDNVSNNAKERFVRMSGAGDDEVVIKNNIINNYQGADADYIKVTDGSNVTIENNVLGVSTAEALQHLCDIAEVGETNITLTDDINGDVMICQKEGVHIKIYGSDDKIYDGTIKVHNASTPNNGSLLISGVNFSTGKVYYDNDNKPYFYFVQADDFGVIDGVTCRYSQNVTVDGCSFKTTNAEKANYAAGVMVRSSKKVIVNDCEAIDGSMHSLVQAQSCDETVVVSKCEINGKNGVAFKQVKDAKVEGTTITATGYGIRFDGNTDNYGITVKNNEITAVQPLIIRKMTGKNNTITLDGTNTLSTEAEYQIVITNDSDDKPYVKPTGTYTLTPNDAASQFKIFPKPMVAKVGSTEYDNINEAIAAWTNGTTLTLLADVTLSDVVTLNSTEHHILDLSTFTMTAASGKNAFVIKACGFADRAERYAFTINADQTNPGGINAGTKSIIYYNYKDSGLPTSKGYYDRPIIKIKGGIFTGSTSSWGTAGIYTIGGSEADQAATLDIAGGTFNCSINGSGKSKLLISGGVFHYSVGSQGDSTALRLIWGGRFKSFGFMTADDNNTKFWIGTTMATSNVGVYVDKEGYLVVGGPVITEAPGENYEKKSYSSWSNYLKYSSAAGYGLYYEK